jgi:hypothetical protein
VPTTIFWTFARRKSPNVAHVPPNCSLPRQSRHTSSGDSYPSAGLSILDAHAWRQQSPYSWVYDCWTICCVRYKGQLTFELWKNSAFMARADDAATLRVVAKAGGAVA